MKFHHSFRNKPKGKAKPARTIPSALNTKEDVAKKLTSLPVRNKVMEEFIKKGGAK
jgi:hypothetical protein